MTTPYQILGVSEHANDTEIKQAYLNLVKENPPDRDQERFQQIQQAYETIKDSDSRLNLKLFHFPETDFNVLLDQAFQQKTELRSLNPNDFFRLLNAVSIDNAVTGAIKNKSS
ncbi:J domain-containing protein [Methylotuvimicrobium sp. KM2]|jgi:DnaJ-class molecular chaperone|uniref:J domain-containing protein n=1 Tax=Methylotuvimicrobium sp. KM2 TaxID=3133976 RepID=UPI003100FB28